jgi:hypothetical protein
LTTENLQSPLVLTHFHLAKAFGWTPAEVQQLTMAQAAMYLAQLDNVQNIPK